MRTYVSRASTVVIMMALALSIAFCMAPAAHAQSADLKASIRTVLAQDPRAASLPPAQLEEMATILSAQAASQGITVRDVAGTYEPTPPACSGAICILHMLNDTGALLLLVLGILAAIAIILAAIHEYKLHVRGA